MADNTRVAWVLFRSEAFAPDWYSRPNRKFSSGAAPSFAVASAFILFAVTKGRAHVFQICCPIQFCFYRYGLRFPFCRLRSIFINLKAGLNPCKAGLLPQIVLFQRRGWRACRSLGVLGWMPGFRHHSDGAEASSVVGSRELRGFFGENGIDQPFVVSSASQR